MGSRLSLANKCLAIFGAVILTIFVITSIISWTKTAELIYDYQEELAKQLAIEWLASREDFADSDDGASLNIHLFSVENIEDGAGSFESRAKKVFEAAGINTIPFPVDFNNKERKLTFIDFIPSASSFSSSSFFVKEIIGRTYYKLKY